MRLLSLVLVLVTAAISFGGDSWPQFRGPAGDGISDAKVLPTTWSETENVRWKTPIHDKGWSSPVILGEQIWLTTARADGKEMFAVCVDRQSGKVIHDLKLITEEKPAFSHEYNSYATPTPVVEKGRVYIHFGSHGTMCLDSTTGDVLWERRDLKCNHFRGPGSSPVLHDGKLILTFDGFDAQYLVALNKEDGKTVWRKDRELKYSSDNGDYKKAYSTPTILTRDGKSQIVSPAAEATVAYDPANGNEVWRFIHGGMNAAARPVFNDEFIFLTSGHTKQLFAVRPGTGTLPADAVGWKSIKGVPSRPSLLLVEDLLYSVSDDGVASCVDPKTGKQHWQERLGKACCASPVFAAGHVYFMDEAGKTYVIAHGSKYKSVAVNTLDEGCMASPAVVGESLFIRTKTHLYCIEKK